jgi:hypothetical protein
MYTGFTMNFRAMFEKAVIEYGFQPDPALQVITLPDNKRQKPTISPAAGYSDEMKYFLNCAQGKQRNEICTAESTRNSIEFVLQEIKSAKKKKRIILK